MTDQEKIKRLERALRAILAVSAYAVLSHEERLRDIQNEAGAALTEVGS